MASIAKPRLRSRFAAYLLTASKKDVYASSRRESRLHRCCNRITRRGVELECLDYKDKDGKLFFSTKKESSPVDGAETNLPIFAEPDVLCGSTKLLITRRRARTVIRKARRGYGAHSAFCSTSSAPVVALTLNSLFAHVKAVLSPKHSVLAYIPVLMLQLQQ